MMKEKSFITLTPGCFFAEKSYDELTMKMVSNTGFVFTKLHRVDLKEWPTEKQKLH